MSLRAQHIYSSELLLAKIMTLNDDSTLAITWARPRFAMLHYCHAVGSSEDPLVIKDAKELALQRPSRPARLVRHYGSRMLDLKIHNESQNMLDAEQKCL
jgi:hypothetical protein